MFRGGGHSFKLMVRGRFVRKRHLSKTSRKLATGHGICGTIHCGVKFALPVAANLHLHH